MLARNPQDFQLKVKDFFGLSQSKKIILYAPTFRQTRNMDVFTFDYEEAISAFENSFKDEFVLLIRLHPNDTMLYQHIKESERVINASSYPDMQELLLASDILITDYSSTMFEFSAIQKKVFLFTKDLQQYLQTEREMYFSITELPFPIAKTEEELIHNILTFDESYYNQNVQSFMNLLNYYPLGSASKEVVQYIDMMIKNKR